MQSKSFLKVAEINSNLLTHTKYSSQTTVFSNRVVGMVVLEIKVDYFMSLLKSIHWLPNSLRIKCKKLTVALQNVTSFNYLHFPTVATLAFLLFLEHPNTVPPQGLGIYSFPYLGHAFPRCSGTPSLMLFRCCSNITFSRWLLCPRGMKQHSITLQLLFFTYHLLTSYTFDSSLPPSSTQIEAQ